MKDFIEQLKRHLGDANVAHDEKTLAKYARTTMDQAPKPAAVAWPKSTEDVQKAVTTASDHGIVVYPISRGKNWGYGDACPASEGALILDLSQMNRIIEINAELGYALIEAGVSQQQLHQHLRENNIPLWLDCTGAGPDSSLVGNTLDHGFGHTRYGDHFLTACGMEIVLADGRILKTGYRHYENAKAACVYPYGTGPYIDGLFCQSNYGVVTQICLWLMPEPEDFCFFFIKIDNDALLPPMIDKLRRLRMQGLLQSAIHIGNDLRILSGAGRYPWKETNGQTPLPENVRQNMRKQSAIGAWNAAGSLTGTKAQVASARAALRKAARGLGKLVFVGDRKLALGEFAAKCLGLVGLGSRMRSQLKSLKPNYGLLKGIPTEEPLMGAQWRLRRPPQNVCDPLDAGCGLMWVSPVLPATGKDAKALLELIAPIYKNHGFETLVTFTLINERSMIAITNVAFDKAEHEETHRARKCYDTLIDSVIKAGYYPYRVSIAGMDKIQNNNDTFWQVATQIKQALDPKDIISRGRYIPPLEK